MFDKQFIRLVNSLIKLCDYNTYKVLELQEISALSKTPMDDLNAKLSYLHDNEIIDVKYNDGKEVCMCVFKRARGLVEHDNLPQSTTKLPHKWIAILMGASLLMGFVGGLLAGLIF